MKTILENEHYYNNTFKVEDNILDIDRVYMMNENLFDDDLWRKLDEIYRSLPYYKDNTTGIPCWLGNEEDGDGIYLWVSVEPSGFQFVGNLPLESFRVWEEKFHSLIGDFPFLYE